MVIHKTIHHLKTRPHHERRAVALLVAMGVVVILFIAWAFIFFAGIQSSATAAVQTQTAGQSQAAPSDDAAGSGSIAPTDDSGTGAGQ